MDLIGLLAVALVAMMGSTPVSAAGTATAAVVDKTAAAEKSGSKYETYRDLIEKAQNLTLQHDRLQASQVLIRGIHKESKNSPAYRELVRTLDSLANLFYTEKAHGLASSAEAIVDTKPKEAAETYAEALRVEDSNLSLLKGLARAQLKLSECGKADLTTTQAEGVDPFSAEVELLRVQVLACEKNFEKLATTLNDDQAELDVVRPFVRGTEASLALEQAVQVSPPDFKKTKSLLVTWETKDSEYPELYFWKWRLAQAQEAATQAAPSARTSAGTASSSGGARTAALRYSQLCQSLSQRKKRAYALDVDLCRGVDEVDVFLKSSGQTMAPPPLSSPKAATGK